MKRKTPDQLRQLLQLDPATGGLTWLDIGSPARRAKYAGKPAFTSTDERGYKQGRIDGVKYYAHRVIWALHTGAWPTEQIDHINGNRADNRVSNLRLATPSQNGANRRQGRGSSSLLGVHFHAGAGKWAASIQKDGKATHLGLFGTEIEAHLVYKMAARAVHGEFAGQ